ncbi:Barstar (barnase inhibitor) [Nocardia amikacinitolerans]|nr:Barstar (barnase inhibitor) [Nocardia amikacinitolerans]
MNIGGSQSSLQGAAYALFSEESDVEIFRASTVSGLFGEAPTIDTSVDIIMSGVIPKDDRMWTKVRRNSPNTHVGNTELWILDIAEKRIGSYHIADTTLGLVETNHLHPDTATLPEVQVNGWMWSRPHPQAESIWSRWRTGGPTRTGTWADMSPERRDAWLEVARIIASTQMQTDGTLADISNEVFIVDSGSIEDRAGFFCALGEAVNGPGGYFGFNLDALSDCLRGGFGAVPPFTLRLRGEISFLGQKFAQDLENLLTHAGVHIEYVPLDPGANLDVSP